MKISLLITAWKEEKTIGKCLESFVGNYNGDYEILLAIPDEPTKEAARQQAAKSGFADKIWFSDFLKGEKPKGKPAELNYLMKKAKGDIWFFGDGDVYYGESVIQHILYKFALDDNIQAVSGRPVSADSKENMMGYWGHLLADAAHHKRLIDLEGIADKRVKQRPFFPVSGYLFAMKPQTFEIPADTLVEDAFISYTIHDQGGIIAYQPKAKVFVRYATTLADYMKQKKRSVGGYVQLWQYGFVTKENNTRSLGRELEYIWFPISYAKNLRQLWWSLLMYPVRFWLWVRIFWERKILKKDFTKTWVRIESTK